MLLVSAPPCHPVKLSLLCLVPLTPLTVFQLSCKLWEIGGTLRSCGFILVMTLGGGWRPHRGDEAAEAVRGTGAQPR